MKIDAWSRAKALPLAKVAGRLSVAFADPFDLPAQEEVSRWARGKIWMLVAPAPDLTDALQRLKSQEDASNPALAMENIMKGDDGDIEMSAGEDAGVDLEMLALNKVDPKPFEGAKIFGPVGCPKCHGTGYKGRGAMMEVLPISRKIRALVEKGGDADLLRTLALEEGMVTLKEAGMIKVRQGLTSLEAAFEVTGGE